MTTSTTCTLGMIGLGVMGRNLLLNMADHGFTVAGYDTDASKVASLHLEAESDHVHGFTNLKDFIAALTVPRMVMLLVPAGAIVDSVIQAVLPYLQADDCLIDGGNSYFKDSQRRADELMKLGIHFLSVGISGGEHGARMGPSIMPGGPLAVYQRIEPLFNAIAAHVGNEPCVTYLGTGAVGHFVKMVHNGIEYGLMQLLAESYAFMKHGLKRTDEQLAEIFTRWNLGELNSYLVEITSEIFAVKDPVTGNRLINEILNVARQKGTGLWTSMSAMELQVPIPTIDIAVAMRDLSVLHDQQTQAAELYSQDATHNTIPETLEQALADALFVAILLTYAQGFALLKVASEQYHYDLNLASVARIWRGGCIIRSSMLDDLCSAFSKAPTLANALLAETLAQKILPRLSNFRTIVSYAAQYGLAIPGLMASLSYFDAYRSASPANLIQAQRDYFGAHTYERNDKPGHFHTDWMNAHD